MTKTRNKNQNTTLKSMSSDEDKHRDTRLKSTNGGGLAAVSTRNTYSHLGQDAVSFQKTDNDRSLIPNPRVQSQIYPAMTDFVNSV